jgi:hypothetical protein
VNNKYTFKPCCEPFSQANSSGSDNEMYGSAITFYTYEGTFAMGSVETKLTYCPFCGKKLKPRIKKIKA